MRYNSKFHLTSLSILSVIFSCNGLFAVDSDDEDSKDPISKSDNTKIKTPISHTNSVPNISQTHKTLLPKSSSANYHSTHSGDVGSTSSSPNSSFLLPPNKSFIDEELQRMIHEAEEKRKKKKQQKQSNKSSENSERKVSFSTASYSSENSESVMSGSTSPSKQSMTMDELNEEISKIKKEGKLKKQRKKEKERKLKEEQDNKKFQGDSRQESMKSKLVVDYTEEYKKLSEMDCDQLMKQLLAQKKQAEDLPNLFEGKDVEYQIEALSKALKEIKAKNSSDKKSKNPVLEKLSGFFK